MHFFDIATSKSAPNVQCFLAFSLANVLRATTACTSKSAPQLRCFVRNWRNYIWLRNVLRATTACNFLISFISHLASWLRTRRLCTLSKVSKTSIVCSISTNDGRRGTLEEDLQRCMSRSTRNMFIRDVRRWGRWFPERGCILEHQILRFAEMILRDKCSTSYDLASLFRGRRSTLDRWSGKSQNAWVRDRQFCTQLSIFEESLAEFFRFWSCQLQKMRKSRRIASFLTLSSVKFQNWGSLGELLRFWCCQVQKLRECRKIASFPVDNCNYNYHYHYTTTTTTNTKIPCYITLNITKPTTSNCTTLHQLPYDHNNYYHSYNYNYNYTTLHYTTLSKLQHTTTTNTYTTATTVRCTTLH